MFTMRAFLDAVGSSYGVGNLTYCQGLGTWGDQLRIKVADLGGTFHFIKEKPPYLSSAEYRQTLLVQEQMSRAGLKCASVYRSTDGDLTANVLGRSYSVHEWLEGDSLSFSLCDLARVGEALGKFHRASRSLGFDEYRPEPACTQCLLPSVSAIAIRNMVAVLQAMKTALGHTETDSIVAILEYAARRIDVGSLEIGWIHGDVHPYNLIGRNSLDPALIDFDEVRIGYTVIDIASSCVISAAWDWPTPTVLPSIRYGLRFDAVDSVIGGYCATNELYRWDLESAPFIMMVLLVRSFLDIKGPGSISPGGTAEAQRLLVLLRELDGMAKSRCLMNF